MIDLDVSRVRDLANADPEFRIAARFWNTAVRFDIGPRAYVMRVEGGEMTAFGPAHDAAEPCTLRVRGDAEEWERLLEPGASPVLSRPFHGGPGPGHQGGG